MKIVKVQTPKHNNLATLGRPNTSPPPSPLLKSLSLERNLRKLEKRISSQEKHDRSVEEEISRMELEWKEIQFRREVSANSRSKHWSSKRNDSPLKEIPHAKIDLGANFTTSRLVMSGCVSGKTISQYEKQEVPLQSSRKKPKVIPHLKMIPVKKPQTKLKKSSVAANGIACINLSTIKTPHKKPGLTMLSPKRLL